MGMPRKKTGRRMRLITVHLTDAYIEALDKLVDAHIYPNRSEAIRAAIRDLVTKHGLLPSEKSGSAITVENLLSELRKDGLMLA